MSELAEPTGDRQRSERRPPSTDRRQVWGIVIGGALGILVVVAVLVMTLGAGDGEPTPTTVAAAPQAESPLMEAVPSTVVVPEGDYTEFCAQLVQASEGFSPTVGIEDFRTIYRDLDFDQVIAVSPTGIQPSLVVLRDSREEVLTALEQMDSLEELAPADVPDGWVPALATVSTAWIQECTKG